MFILPVLIKLQVQIRYLRYQRAQKVVLLNEFVGDIHKFVSGFPANDQICYWKEQKQ